MTESGFTVPGRTGSAATGAGSTAANNDAAWVKKRRIIVAAGVAVALIVGVVIGSVVADRSGKGTGTEGNKADGHVKPGSDPWPMFMRTPSHDASTTTAAATPPAAALKAAWVYNMSHVVSSSPTLVGDVVLAASGCGPHPCAGGEIAALYRSSGAVKWSTPLGSGVAYSSPMPSKDQSLVYIGTDEGKIVAISVETGKVLHSFQTNDTVSSTPCVAPDGSVFIGSHDNNLYKLNAKLKLVWKFATKGQVWSSPAVSDDGSMVYVGSVDKGIYAVRADSGNLVWLHNTTGRIKSSPIVNSNQVSHEPCMTACFGRISCADSNLRLAEGANRQLRRQVLACTGCRNRAGKLALYLAGFYLLEPGRSSRGRRHGAGGRDRLGLVRLWCKTTVR